MGIQKEIDNAVKFVARANRFIEKVHELIYCEICYAKTKQCSYQCERHQVCKTCFDRIDICPFCRSPKKGTYPNLWVFNDIINQWVLLTDDIIQKGISTDFLFFRSIYMAQFEHALKSALDLLNNLDLHFGSLSDNQAIVRMAVSFVNCKCNFPIFVLKDKKEINYDKDRWRTIEKKTSAIKSVMMTEIIRVYVRSCEAL